MNTDDKGLPVYVLYNDTTSDHPGEWVVRRQVVLEGEVRCDPDLCARGRSREECVDNLLRDHPHVGGLVYLGHSSSDDKCIAGTFL